MEVGQGEVVGVARKLLHQLLQTLSVVAVAKVEEEDDGSGEGRGGAGGSGKDGTHLFNDRRHVVSTAFSL